MNKLEITEADIAAVLAEQNARRMIKPARDYADDVAKLFNPDITQKIHLPFSKTKDVFDIREGELTIIGGYNGHGKSLLLNQIMLDLIRYYDKKVAIASLEMQVKVTIQRMMIQYSQTKNPSIADQKKFFEKTDGLYLYDHIGSVETSSIYAAVKIARERHGVDYFIVDSLMRCGVNGDDYNKQKEFVESLCNLAKDTGMHIFLVAHLRKGERGDAAIPSRYEISGSGDIINQADNVIIFWRNKAKEEAKRQGREQSDKPDAILKIDKQRNGTGQDGSFGLYYNFNTMCYEA